MRHLEPGARIEVISLIVIAVVLAVAGRPLLARLHLFGPAAVAMLGVALLGVMLSIRRTRGPHGDKNELTRRVGYVAAILLAIYAVIDPARWAIGGTIAAAELTIAFDVFMRVSHRIE